MRISATRFASWTLVTLALLVGLSPVSSEAQSLDALQVSITSSQSTYERGTEALVTLQVKNTSLLPVTVNFANGQEFEFTAQDASSAVVWTWSLGKSFPAPYSKTLAAGATWQYAVTWNFNSDAGSAVLDGDYTVRGVFLGNYTGRSGTKAASTLITLFTPDPLEVTFSTDKSSYSRSQPARLTLTVTNIASYPVTISFASGKSYDFSAKSSSGQTVWTWSNGKTFSPAPQEVVLAPGEYLQYTQSWSFVNNSGLGVMAGTYTVSGVFLGSWYGETGTKSGQKQISVSLL
jgi:Intracellular proteinase inhibitor